MQKIFFFIFSAILYIFISSYFVYNSSNYAISPTYICFTNIKTLNLSFSNFIKKYDTNGSYIDRENDIIFINHSSENVYFYQFVYIVSNEYNHYSDFMEFEEWKNYNNELKSINITSQYFSFENPNELDVGYYIKNDKIFSYFKENNSSQNFTFIEPIPKGYGVANNSENLTMFDKYGVYYNSKYNLELDIFNYSLYKNVSKMNNWYCEIYK